MIFIGNSSNSLSLAGTGQTTFRLAKPLTAIGSSYGVGGSAGELMFLALTWISTTLSNYNSTTPSGWTLISAQYSTATGLAMGCNVIGKRLDSSDSATITIGDAGITAGRLFVVRYNNGNSTMTPGSNTFQSTLNTPATQTISISALTDPVISLGIAWSGNDTTTFPTLTMTAHDDSILTYYSSVSSFGAAVGYKLYNSSPSDITASMTDVGSNAQNSFYIKIT